MGRVLDCVDVFDLNDGAKRFVVKENIEESCNEDKIDRLDTQFKKGEDFGLAHLVDLGLSTDGNMRYSGRFYKERWEGMKELYEQEKEKYEELEHKYNALYKRKEGPHNQIKQLLNSNRERESRNHDLWLVNYELKQKINSLEITIRDLREQGEPEKRWERRMDRERVDELYAEVMRLNKVILDKKIKDMENK